MSAHDHSKFVAGCFRCDLSQDEYIANMEEQIPELEAELERLSAIVREVAQVDPWVNTSGWGDYLWSYECRFCERERASGQPKEHTPGCPWLRATQEADHA